ncbi:hypothetical protein [Magnetospirillum sulfuroxidans]|uniref:Uncharacterized protein n=1 Tax=Magnetospirillum sulfuroxidans TaxID=611300 RepID=A0ABS5IBM8_9PROT|nr:hypothetical protein [Magnetospirillum sulfuroxidans]MBR9971153.1 hypothetical protein [Magnetospirillum sulfuroxidans]
MGLGEFNFLALPVVVLLSLFGAPLAFRRAGFQWAKIVFGTVAVLFSALGMVGVIVSIQNKAGLGEIPLAWLVVPALGFALYRLSQIKAPA